ncbi:hypothetical protein PIB30_053038 [Stylosanthes scabra]|uniref:Retrotransposon gag domain-containing protein n=1 Tax=Stylosanthes scabra TaxID=79078 RepID=A0ABU6SJD6_9FABA|nr:hypothetical protein [Stylosanthes scabra]
MSDGSVNSNSCWEDVCKQNRSEIAALQRGQVETMAMISEHQRDNQSKSGSMETSLKRMEQMLTKSLKLKQPTHNFTYRMPVGDFSADSHHRQWLKGVKAELPFFDGEGVEEWTFRAKEYFELYAVPEAWRVSLLSFHLTGPAYNWYRLTEGLKCELQLAKPKTYGDVVALAKLHEQKNQPEQDLSFETSGSNLSIHCGKD